jgi:hypothetical protein
LAELNNERNYSEDKKKNVLFILRSFEVYQLKWCIVSKVPLGHNDLPEGDCMVLISGLKW